MKGRIAGFVGWNLGWMLRYTVNANREKDMRFRR